MDLLSTAIDNFMDKLGLNFIDLGSYIWLRTGDLIEKNPLRRFAKL
jgi:hypothetical protein